MAARSVRTRVDRDLERPGLSRDKVLAAVVRLLESTGIRVGNDEYAPTNNSFGLTTLCDQHVTVNGAKLRFSFRGKGGKRHICDLTDRRLAQIVQRCQELPGAAKSNIVQAIDRVAERLNNTRTVCRKYYVHPLIFEHYTAGTMAAIRSAKANGAAPKGLTAEERSVLRLLASEGRGIPLCASAVHTAKDAVCATAVLSPISNGRYSEAEESFRVMCI